MNKYLAISIVFFTSFTAAASENNLLKSTSREQYKECVAVTLYTMKGRELNAIVETNRPIVDINKIPEGWTVVGVTTKKEGAISSPYIVICH